MINPNHILSLTRQAQLLELSRALLYSTPAETCAAHLQLIRRLDALRLEWPFLGSQMLRDILRLEGIVDGRWHLATLMRTMGSAAIYRQPAMSRRHPLNAIYPYLLRRLEINRPNKIRAAAVNYIPMARGFVYLVAVMDWYRCPQPRIRLSSAGAAESPPSPAHSRFWR